MYTQVEVLFLNGIYKIPVPKIQDQNIPSEEALINYYDKDIVLIDLRTAREYEEFHVPGSKLLPLEELANRVHEIPEDKTVYLICRTGNRTLQGMRFLLTKGYHNVYNVLNGIVAWEGPLEGTADFI